MDKITKETTLGEFKEILTQTEKGDNELENFIFNLRKANNKAVVDFCFAMMLDNSTMKKYAKFVKTSNDRVVQDSYKAVYGADPQEGDDRREFLYESQDLTEKHTISDLIGKINEIKFNVNNKDTCLDIIKQLLDISIQQKEGIDDKMTYQQIIKNLINKGVSQLVLTGAPGTGKTYIAKKIAEEIIAEEIIAEEIIAEEKTPEKIDFVQFHPSYDYTDFVEGLRPTEIDGQVTFKKIDGIFKAFCRKVVEQNQKDKKYFFIIDEINRADLSKVLGELMFCLEKDKRGMENRVKTQYQNLPTYDIKKGCILENDCFEDGFYIPKNVVIIGTMNDIDRSVESFDFALRRRFQWLEIEVTEDLLKEAFKSENYGFYNDEKFIDELVKSIVALNKVIGEDMGKDLGLNKHYYISQGHFTNLKKSADLKALCKYVWDYRIKNILEEYVRGEEQNDIKEFLDLCENAFIPLNPPTGDDNTIENEQGNENPTEDEQGNENGN